MNYLFSHPRSGRNWQRYRLLCFVKQVLNRPERSFGELDKLIHFTHIGYGNAMLGHGPQAEKRWIAKLTPQDNITVLLREAKAVVNSYYDDVYTRYSKGFSEAGINPESIDQFVKSDLGVKHYCDFMKTAAAIQQNSQCKKWRWIYYEDAFSKDFLGVLPEMLDINHELTSQEKALLFNSSKTSPTKRVGTVDSYKKNLSISSQRYIDNYIEKYCSYDPYLVRYSSND